MTDSGKGWLKPQQIRTLAIVWIGVVIMVGVCTFLGIIWALNNPPKRPPQGIGGQVAATQSDQPTATIAATLPAVPGITPSPQPTIPPNQDKSFGYGIQAQLHMNTRQTLDQVEQLGMGWVKQQIRWADLEPQSGQPNWDALDKIFSRASERNTKVLIGIVDAPDWARSVTAEGKAGPPNDPQLYVNYVSQLVQRYKGAVHAVEIWNEQNLEREWYTAGGLSAADYMTLLTPTAEAIHQIDPGIIVISGALTPTGVDDGVLAIDDFRYLQQLIDAGLLDHVDCVGAHHNGYNITPDTPYDNVPPDPGAFFRGPFDNPHHSWSFYSTLTGYHDLVAAAGRDTPLCVTEFGWATVEGMDGDPRESFEFAHDNTLQEQASNIVSAFQLMHDWGFVRLAILFNLDFSPKAGGNTQDDATLYSILTPNGGPRPAFDAVSAMPKPP